MSQYPLVKEASVVKLHRKYRFNTEHIQLFLVLFLMVGVESSDAFNTTDESKNVIAKGLIIQWCSEYCPVVNSIETQWIYITRDEWCGTITVSLLLFERAVEQTEYFYSVIGFYCLVVVLAFCVVLCLALESLMILRFVNKDDDVIKWKHFPRNWPFVRGIHRSPVNSCTKASDAELWCLLWSAAD